MDSSNQDRFFVYFRRGAATLSTAREVLPIHDLQAARVERDAFTVVAEGLSFHVTLQESAEVAAAAVRVAGTEDRWPQLAECTARFVVEISDLAVALDEINTMMELQGALQDCSEGYLVLPWNDGILGPWGLEQ